MSLRARLILGLLVVAAAGLVTLAAITYAEQRSFQLSRVDQEAQAGVRFIDRYFDCHGVNVGGTAPGAFGCGPGEGGPEGPQVTLPAGTYGYRRGPSGTTIGRIEVSSLQENGVFKRFPAPSLPARVPVGQAITVGSISGTSFRVYAVQTGDEPGTTIIAIPLNEVEQTLHRLLAIEALVVGGVLAALAALSWWLVRLGLRPLDRIATTAGAIAAGDLSRRVTPANDRTEVGRLGLALNAMLAQIEKAFRAQQASEDRLRRFLADASHELRTPLAAIRGYAELFRLGAAKDPDEAAAAMRRIEDEAIRMGELVENLLTLARLDEAPATAREPVELTRLVAEIAEDARVTAPDREISFDANGALTALGDPGQLRQVVANLVRNALVHTPPGTPIDLHLTKEAGSAKLEVRDHGSGLPTDDPNILFDRFWRAQPGRGRGAGGAGLGLSIVREIVANHGGSVAAANAPGGGASFTVRLPLAAETAGHTRAALAGGPAKPER